MEVNIDLGSDIRTQAHANVTPNEDQNHARGIIQMGRGDDGFHTGMGMANR